MIPLTSVQFSSAGLGILSCKVVLRGSSVPHPVQVSFMLKKKQKCAKGQIQGLILLSFNYSLNNLLVSYALRYKFLMVFEL